MLILTPQEAEELILIIKRVANMANNSLKHNEEVISASLQFIFNNSEEASSIVYKGLLQGNHFPAAQVGWIYKAGVAVNADGVSIEQDDFIICIVTTQAQIPANWMLVKSNKVIPLQATINRTNDFIDTIDIVKPSGNITITVTRDINNYISSITNGVNTWTFTRTDNKITSWEVT